MSLGMLMAALWCACGVLGAAGFGRAPDQPAVAAAAAAAVSPLAPAPSLPAPPADWSSALSALVALQGVGKYGEILQVAPGVLQLSTPSLDPVVEGQCLFIIAEALGQLGRLNEGADVLRVAMDYLPQRAYTWNYLGDLFLFQLKLAEAGWAYKHAATLPDSVDVSKLYKVRRRSGGVGGLCVAS